VLLRTPQGVFRPICDVRRSVLAPDSTSGRLLRLRRAMLWCGVVDTGCEAREGQRMNDGRLLGTITIGCGA